MKRNIFLLSVLVLFSSFTHAIPLKRLKQTPMIIKDCKYIQTDNSFDLALINRGYFVIKRGKESLFYTRYGAFALNSENYMVTSSGDYVQGINRDSPFNTLSTIQLSTEDMEARATDKIDLKVNLPATAEINEKHEMSMTIYDSLGSAHVLTAWMNELSLYLWQVSIVIDSQPLTTGQLIFNQEGKLINQTGLSKFQWEAQLLTMSFKGSTQYDFPFQINSIQSNGHQSGHLAGIYITPDGEIDLFYTNGLHKFLDQNVAVSFFDNPAKLRKILDNLYAASSASGPGSIQPSNSYGAILSGYIEEKFCLPND